MHVTLKTCPSNHSSSAFLLIPTFARNYPHISKRKESGIQEQFDTPECRMLVVRLRLSTRKRRGLSHYHTIATTWLALLILYVGIPKIHLISQHSLKYCKPFSHFLRLKYYVDIVSLGVSAAKNTPLVFTCLSRDRELQFMSDLFLIPNIIWIWSRFFIY